MPKRTPAVEVHNRLVTVDGSGLLFDTRPVVLDGFHLLGRSITPIGRPTAKDLQHALALACEFHESSPYWIGGLVAYGESREDWKEKLSQIMSVTKLARQTLINLGYVYRHTTEKSRAMAPSPEHAKAVAKLPEAEQIEVLSLARSEEMTVRDLQLHLRDAKRRKVLEGQAVLEGLYRVLMVDCPWKYNDRPPSGSGAGQHYDGMSIDELCAMPVAAHCTPNAAMGFWVPAPFLYDDHDGAGVPGPYRIIRAWDFTPKAQIIWDKVDHNYGHYVSVRHEIFIICTRGSCTPDRLTPMIDSVYAERPTDHSAKPAHFAKTMERLWDGPYLELFGRDPRENWTVFGDDARLWAEHVGEEASV